MLCSIQDKHFKNTLSFCRFKFLVLYLFRKPSDASSISNEAPEILSEKVTPSGVNEEQLGIPGASEKEHENGTLQMDDGKVGTKAFVNDAFEGERL